MPSQKPIIAQESYADLTFPVRGIDLARSFSGQRTGTTPVGVNVRGFEPTTQRPRGGSRPGLLRYLATQPFGANLIQELNSVVGSGYTPPGGTMEASQSGRVVTLVAVVRGNIFTANSGDVSWTSPTNNIAVLNAAGVVYSAANNQKLWFADGTHYVYYDPSKNQVFPWVASQGTLPVDAANNAPRLICTWRGRTVLSGLLLDPQDWFMSAVTDPTNWNYSPLSVTPTQAIAGINAPQGLVGDVVTSLVPYSDDVLIFGGDHTLWMMRGDPMAGGQIDLISDAIGMAWGQPWCKDPYGNLYFVSNRTGIYTLIPGQAPQRISQQIEQLVNPVDTGANTIRLIWDDRFQGLHIFITPTAAAGATTHYFYELRTAAWWQDTFSNVNHNPLCCCTFDGNAPGDRTPLIGSWDGYVRSINPSATTDDAFAIASSVVLGPLLTKDLDDVILKEVQAILGASSGAVSYAVYVGTTAEIALASTPVATGTWVAGRNFANLIRRSGHAVWVKMTSSSPWQMETVRARIQGLGKVRRRLPI